MLDSRFIASVSSLQLRRITQAGLIAATYTVLALAFQPISFGIYQVRIAEALTVLPFLTAAAVPGLYVGCLLANIIGGMGWLDILLGPLITLVAAVATRWIYHLSRHRLNRILVVLPTVLIWAGAVYILTDGKFDAHAILGLAISLLALLIIRFAEKMRLCAPERRQMVNLMRGLALIGVIEATLLMGRWVDWRMVLIGGFALLAAAATVWLLARVWYAGDNPNMLLAPMPPVLFNAFGVSAYLAPIIGVDYWFSVQMVGIGQLIACYLLGLPLLALLKRRNLFF